MKWSVQQLLSKRAEGIQIDTSLDLSELMSVDQEIRYLSPVKVTGNGYILKEEATFQLKISGEMTLPCARTLNDVNYPFTIDATEIFKFNVDVELDEEDEDVHYVTESTIDLIPYIKEQVLLEKPYRVFSDVEESSVPLSGQDWKVSTGVEEKKKVDPRLAKLAKFFEEKNDMD